MMADAGALALVSLLLPAISFLLLALVAPFRRLGRPAAWLSIAFALVALIAAVLACLAHAAAISGVADASHVTRLLWDWLPSDGTSIATIGVLVDADSTIMLILVALVAFLVQL